MQNTITAILGLFGIEERFTNLETNPVLSTMVDRGMLISCVIDAELRNNDSLNTVLETSGWDSFYKERFACIGNDVPYRTDNTDHYIEYTADSIYVVEYRPNSKGSLRFSRERFKESLLLCPVMGFLENKDIYYTRKDSDDSIMMVPLTYDILMRQLAIMAELKHRVDYSDRNYIEYLCSDNPLEALYVLSNSFYERIEPEEAQELLSKIPKHQLIGTFSGVYSNAATEYREVSCTHIYYLDGRINAFTVGEDKRWFKYGYYQTFEKQVGLILEITSKRRMTTRFSKRINGQYRTVATLFAMYGRDVLTDNVSKTYKLLHIMYHGYFPDFIQRVIKHKVDVSRMEWDDVIKEVTGEHGPLKRIK